MSIIRDLIESTDRLSAITTWHLTRPLVDHDGGDEDDRLVEQRCFERAIRHPGARMFRQRNRLYVIREPDPLVPLIPVSFQDRGDDAEPRRG